MRIWYLFGLLGAALIVGGCGKHDLRLALQPGDVRVLSHESDHTIAIAGKEGEVKQRHSARYRLEVRERAASTATVNVTIVDMTTEIEMPKSWGAARHPEADIAVLARGLSFSMDLGSDGKVSNVQGADAIVETITQSLSWPGIDRDLARNVVLQQFSQESIQELFNNLFTYVPEKSVGVGDSWEDTQVHTTGMPFRSLLTYTLRSVENDVAIIDYTADIESHHTKATIALGIKYKFSGEEHGSIRVDTASGWVTSGDGQLALKSQTDSGTTSVNGQDRMASERGDEAAPGNSK